MPFGIEKFNKNNIPDELADGVTRLDKLDTLKSEVINDKVSKLNAIKQLGSMYKDLAKLATGELLIDEKGNISVIHMEKPEQEKQKEEQEQEER